MRLTALRRLILSQYDTLYQFADSIGVTREALSNWITGKHQMQGQTVRRFTEALHIRQEDIGRYFYPDVPDTAHIDEGEA